MPIQTMLGLSAIAETYSVLRSQGPERPITERLLDHLEVKYNIAARDLELIPRKGAVLVVANHPFGMLEGAVLATAMLRIRPDVKFLANSMLTVVPELRDLVIAVDVAGSPAANRSGMRAALEFLRGGGLLVVFPAGEVSHFQWGQWSITDPAWSPSIARMIRIIARKGAALPVIPVYIGGANSLLFQTAGMVHPRLRTALLARELLNKRRKLVDVRIGRPIDSGKLLALQTDEERTEYLRWRTYLLANRSQFKPNTRLPMAARRRKQLEPVAAASNAAEMTREVASLELLDRSGNLEAYITSADRIPAVLREIGRLREITFRAVGEGSGKPCDLDYFDDCYLHLFVWNAEKREVVGAYRLGKADGPLYTASLFQYSSEFLSKLGPALELGRSFVRAEYQKGFTPLLLLWKGIGKFVARNPQYKTL
ncbi:MAG: lysophospholipid acyltransferase family protein, partial [Bryobacteraceae bacterium]